MAFALLIASVILMGGLLFVLVEFAIDHYMFDLFVLGLFSVIGLLVFGLSLL